MQRELNYLLKNILDFLVYLDDELFIVYYIYESLMSVPNEGNLKEAGFKIQYNIYTYLPTKIKASLSPNTRHCSKCI